MIIHLKLEDYLAMVQHARETAPVEDCGLIGGRIDEATGEKFVEKVFFLTNTDHSEEHFSLDPKEQFAAVKELRAQGLELLGTATPHPHPARAKKTSALPTTAARATSSSPSTAANPF